MPCPPVNVPAELRAPVRRVRRRPGAEWADLLALRLFGLPFILAGVAAILAMIGVAAWAAFGTDRDARVRDASRGTTRKGQPYYRASYTYELDGRLQYGSAIVPDGTYHAFRLTPETKPTIRIRSFGRPPLVFDEPVDRVGLVVGLTWAVGAVVCAVATIVYHQAFIKPRRIKKLYRQGAITPTLSTAPLFWQKNFKKLVDLTYRYVTPDGQARTGRVDALPQRRWDALAYSGDIRWVLYDPAHPDRSILHGLGPYRCVEEPRNADAS
jgi:hypothetical protein